MVLSSSTFFPPTKKRVFSSGTVLRFVQTATDDREEYWNVPLGPLGG